MHNPPETQEKKAPLPNPNNKIARKNRAILLLG
jgi:hypothetical protein